MNGDRAVEIALAVGWLVLVGSALASRRLPLRQTLRMALLWIAIFATVLLGVMLVQRLTGGSVEPTGAHTASRDNISHNDDYPTLASGGLSCSNG